MRLANVLHVVAKMGENYTVAVRTVLEAYKKCFQQDALHMEL